MRMRRLARHYRWRLMPTGSTRRAVGNDAVEFRGNAPVAQWIEQPPPKGQVARSIRVRGAIRRAAVIDSSNACCR